MKKQKDTIKREYKTFSHDETAEIKKKIEKLEAKTKNYTDATSEDDGLIGAIMKFFGK